MSDCEILGGVTGLLVFFLSGWISPIDAGSWWSFVRWMVVLIALFAISAVGVALICGQALWEAQ